jgi:uncharacterized protein (DUF4213/DUF364 family)
MRTKHAALIKEELMDLIGEISVWDLALNKDTQLMIEKIYKELEDVPMSDLNCVRKRRI